MSLVQRFYTGTFVVIRSKKGSYVKGRYVPGPTEKLKIDGSMQPSSAKELKLPEEGNRIKQVWKFYSDDRIVTSNTKTLAEADTVIIDGETYKAMQITAWNNTDLDYVLTALWREPEQ